MNSEASPPRLFRLSTSPHGRQADSVTRIMGCVLIALGPAGIAAVYFFGLRAFMHMAVAVVFAAATEAAIQKLRGVPVTVSDLSAVLTGLLLAFNVPPGAPGWVSAVGAVFAIGVVKQAFGGLGYNFMNPALGARAFLLAAWPVYMTAAWLAPGTSCTLSGLTSGIDAVSSATPLAMLKEFVGSGAISRPQLKEALLPLFLGGVGGCVGETSALALLAGGVFLAIKRYIDIRIPVVYIGTVFLLTWLFNGSGSYFTKEALVIPVFHVLSGGLVLGAIFMATDMVTSPITPVGVVLFGAGCGALTVLIRLVGGYPEGVSYSIILMNVAAPLLDRVKRPRIYGTRKTSNE